MSGGVKQGSKDSLQNELGGSLYSPTLRIGDKKGTWIRERRASEEGLAQSDHQLSRCRWEKGIIVPENTGPETAA